MTKGKKASNYKYLTKNKKAKQRCTQFIKAHTKNWKVSWRELRKISGLLRTAIKIGLRKKGFCLTRPIERKYIEEEDVSYYIFRQVQV